MTSKKKFDKKNKRKILPLFLLMIVAVLIAASIYLYLRTRSGSESGTIDVEENAEEDGLTWATYKNEKFGYSVEYPKFLYKEELEGRGDYLGFTIFSENEFTQAKGMGIGVRKDSLEDEVKRLKEEFGSDSGVELVNESETKVDEMKAVVLEYQPIEIGEDLMAKNIIVVEKSGYAYSISTVPEQMGRVVESFRLND